eukprot:scaffold313763_cov15-Prasinocladus_malaysianus.AAC.1
MPHIALAGTRKCRLDPPPVHAKHRLVSLEVQRCGQQYSTLIEPWQPPCISQIARQDNQPISQNLCHDRLLEINGHGVGSAWPS